MVSPDDVAAMIAFLLSDAGGNISGPVARRRRQRRDTLRIAHRMSKVAIIGSGFIGRAWAITFARAGHHGGALGRRPGSAAEGHRLHPLRCFPSLPRTGCSTSSDPTRCLPTSRRRPISPRRSHGADYVQENTPEKLDVKIALLRGARRAGAEGRGDRQLELGDSALALHRGAARPAPLPRRPPDQSALSDPRRGGRARALDLARGGRASARLSDRGTARRRSS